MSPRTTVVTVTGPRPSSARRSPVAAGADGGAVHVLAGRCSHMSGPPSDSELTDGCLTCA